MPKLNIRTQHGTESQIDVATGSLIMEALRDGGLVDATCGGVASCGTCHIYFADAALAGEQTEDEGYMLEGLADFVEIRDGSRLSCQVKVTEAHDGASIEIAPEA